MPLRRVSQTFLDKKKRKFIRKKLPKAEKKTEEGTFAAFCRKIGVFRNPAKNMSQ